MSDSVRCDSDSELSTSSSWSLVDEKSTDHLDNAPKDDEIANKIEEIHPDAIETKEESLIDCEENDDIQSLDSNSDSSLSIVSQESASHEKLIEHGCLTFDEFLRERKLEHDYESDHKSLIWENLWDQNRNNKKKKQHKKCKAEYLTTLKVIGAVLSIAGISFVCMLAPHFGKQGAPENLRQTIETNFKKIETPIADAHQCQVFLDKSIDAKLAKDPAFIGACVQNSGTESDAKNKNNPTNPMTYNEYLKSQEEKPKSDNQNAKAEEAHEESKVPAPETRNKLKGKARNPSNVPKKTAKKLASKELNHEQPSKRPKTSEASTKEVTKKKAKQHSESIRKSTHENTQVTLPPDNILNWGFLQTLNNIKPTYVSKDSPKTSTAIEDSKLDHPKEQASTIPSNVFKFEGKNSKEGRSPKTARFFIASDLVACNLIQDILLMKITSKLRAKEKVKEKKLKKKLDKKKLRLNKMESEEPEPEIGPEPESKRSCTLKIINEVKSQSKRQLPSTQASTLKLLDELPFKKDYTQEKKCEKNVPLRIYVGRPRLRENKRQSDTFLCNCQRDYRFDFGCPAISKASLQGFRARKEETPVNCDAPERNINLIRYKPRQYLTELTNRRAERVRMLEQMRRENRLKIEALMKERRDKMKKRDFGSGMYTVPIPEYKDVCQTLVQLRKRQMEKAQKENGGAIESSSSSDSDIDNNKVPTIENKMSNEFMAALRVGKKVSHTFKEWTLKKAPTLTCLKNYCNSKVSQLSEKFSTPIIKEVQKKSNLEKEELETLKSRKEKHEQLKKFWRSKQQYLDRRIEICELLKNKLSGSDLEDSQQKAEEQCDASLSQGVQILDSIINDVLRSVKINKNNNDEKIYPASDESATSKSVHQLAPEVEEEKSKSKLDGKSGALVKHKRADATSDALYKWLFDKKGAQIKKRDRILWSPLPPGFVPKNDVSKHDPARAFREKIITNQH